MADRVRILTPEKAATMFAPVAPSVFEAAVSPPRLADVPIITMETAAPSGTLVRELRSGGTSGPVDMANDPSFLYDGAPAFLAQVNNPTLFVKPDLLPGGTAQAAYYQSRISFTTSARTVAVKYRLGATTAGIRVRVGRRWVTQELSRFTGLAAGNNGYLTLRFPSRRVREIAVEDAGSSLAFGGVYVPTGETVTRPAPYDLKLAVLGDSYSGGAGTPPTGATRLETWANFFARSLEDHLGVRVSFINFGIGGTGYVASATPFSTRADAIKAYAPDILVILGSRNDGNSTSIQAAVASLLASFAAIPQVFVSGPSTTGFEANNEQVKSATLAAGRVYWDGLAGQWITNSDLGPEGSPVVYVHPTLDGHKKIAAGALGAYVGSWAASQTVGADPGGGTTPVTPPATYADVLDTFARTASAGTNFGTTDNGKAWVANTTGGTIVIDADGAGWSAASTTLWNSIAAASNGVLKATRSKGTGKGGRLIFRQTGGTYLMFYGNGTYYAFLRMVNGTPVGTTFVTTTIPADGDLIEVALDGDFVAVKVNGTQVYSTTDAANSTGGIGVGIATFTGQLDSRWKRFEFTEKRPA